MHHTPYLCAIPQLITTSSQKTPREDHEKWYIQSMYRLTMYPMQRLILSHLIYNNPILPTIYPFVVTRQLMSVPTSPNPSAQPQTSLS